MNAGGRDTAAGFGTDDTVIDTGDAGKIKVAVIIQRLKGRL